MSDCKFYNKHLKTIEEYIHCLYSIEGCESGGMLHILLDDDNYDDDDVLYCLQECIKHPEREEAAIGKMICEEYLKLSNEQRSLLRYSTDGWHECSIQECEKCPFL